MKSIGKNKKLRRFFIIGFVFCALAVFCLLTIRPTFNLDGNNIVELNVDAKFVDPGFKASLCGFDLKSHVIVTNNINIKKPGSYQVFYSLDFAIFHIKKARTVKLFDKTVPVLKLIGDDNISQNIGVNYEDKGATAVDDIDGDLTKKIITINNVDTSTAGTYKVIYNVTDSSNNPSSIERTVKIISLPVTNNGVPILMYHFFYDASKGQTGPDSNYTEISSFRQQMKYLVDNKFYFPTWAELNNYLDSKSGLPSKSVLVADDDGSSSFFSLAYPVLKEYNVKATSFLVTSWSGDPNQYNVDRSLISFQSHSDNMHQGGCKGGHGGLFLCISDSDALKDLNTSISLLNSNEVFCYPFGDYTNRDEKLLSQVGYKMAVTTNYGKAKFGADKLALPRIRVSGGESLSAFIASVN